MSIAQCEMTAALQGGGQQTEDAVQTGTAGKGGGGPMKKAAVIILIILLLLGGASLGAFYLLNNTAAGVAFRTANRLKKVESVTADIQMDMNVETEVSGLAGLLSKARSLWTVRST